MKKEKCIICRKPLNNGGIIINGRGICKNCEGRIIEAMPNTDFYEYYKNCIRKTLVQFIPRGVTKDCQDYHL